MPVTAVMRVAIVKPAPAVKAAAGPAAWQRGRQMPAGRGAIKRTAAAHPAMAAIRAAVAAAVAAGVAAGDDVVAGPEEAAVEIDVRAIVSGAVIIVAKAILVAAIGRAAGQAEQASRCGTGEQDGAYIHGAPVGGAGGEAAALGALASSLSDQSMTPNSAPLGSASTAMWPPCRSAWGASSSRAPSDCAFAAALPAFSTRTKCSQRERRIRASA